MRPWPLPRRSATDCSSVSRAWPPARAVRLTRYYRPWCCPPLLVEVYLRIDRHAYAQAVVLIFTGIKINAHRYPLHHFDVVAGGILGRQQAETRTAGPPDTRNVACILAAVSIHAEPHFLPRLHPFELCFLEVHGYPNIVQGNHNQELLARRDIVAEFHRFLVDDTGDRRGDGAVAEVQASLIERGLLLRNLGRGRARPGLAHRHLLRGG